jgi:hypothetical protein
LSDLPVSPPLSEVGSILPASPKQFVANLVAAGIPFRVSSEQADGITPIYVAAPMAAIRHLVPKDGDIQGEVVRFWDDWICVFCNCAPDEVG